jgi:hypothetical protein
MSVFITLSKKNNKPQKLSMATILLLSVLFFYQVLEATALYRIIPIPLVVIQEIFLEHLTFEDPIACKHGTTACYFSLRGIRNEVEALGITLKLPSGA